MTLIMFFVGLFFGGAVALVVLSCFQIERCNKYEREIKKLKEIIKREMGK